MKPELVQKLPFVIVSLTLFVTFFNYVILPTLLPPHAKAEPKVEQNEDICRHLQDYQNGAEFVEFCKNV